VSCAEDKIASLGLELPEVAAPLAAYVPAVRSGPYVFTAGQLPLVEGKLPLTGKVGGEITPEEAKELARTCALNALAAVKSVVGDLDRIARVVKVVGYVASAPDFTGQPGVVNGASELLGEVLGDAGVHARSAVGVAVLPLDAPVEVEIQVEVQAENQAENQAEIQAGAQGGTAG
jgi:enamine deaminase RidA (YjgF/YER057c/UK114 family)